MLYLLDTNMVIYATKNVPSVISALAKKSPDEMAITTVTLAELRFGACKSHWPEKTHLKLSRFLEPWTILPFDKKAAEKYGEIRFQLESQGQPIGDRDMQIAAVALARNMTVVTHNVGEFTRIAHLEIEDWYNE